ncbi:MAG: hypothetical protein LQ349_008306 [Xanthoria aureola]|nr:MAG: hypothetical protein LQ349_008306 [Xanthoria aureola]
MPPKQIRPWNDHTCRFPEAYPSVYLTFSFGCTISRSAIPAMFHYIEVDIQREIAEGLAQEAIHDYNIVRREDLELEFHLVVDRGRRMDFQAALEVVQLLRRCGFERGYYDEMWGVIYDRSGRRCGEFGLAFRREVGVESA